MPYAGQALSVHSKSLALQRLKVVLVQDRAEANRGIVEKLRDDIIATVARYAEVDADRVEVKILRQDEASVVLARLPVRSLKRVN